MNLSNQRKVAAKVLGVGVHRVRLDPEKAEEIKSALTRNDIRKLIEDDIISIRPIKGVSKGRARELKETRKYGHRKGQGSRQGAKGARRPKKELWMKKIRALRRRLREFRKDGTIDASNYHKLYMKAKGGEFRNVSHLNAYIDMSVQRKVE